MNLFERDLTENEIEEESFGSDIEDDIQMDNNQKNQNFTCLEPFK